MFNYHNYMGKVEQIFSNFWAVTLSIFQVDFPKLVFLKMGYPVSPRRTVHIQLNFFLFFSANMSPKVDTSFLQNFI